MSYFLTSQEEIDFIVSADTLSPGDLILQKFEGHEELSKPFVFKALFQSSNASIDVASLIGQGMTIEIKFDEGSRYFHGVCGQFEQLDTADAESEVDLTNYQATLYPALWKLKFASNCRIFQKKSALDIIKSVLSDSNVTIKDKTQGAGASKRAYCVQYNDSDFDFISRLMEAEGLFYYFEFADGSHTMILADSNTAHKPCPNKSSVDFEKSAQESAPIHKVLQATYQAKMVTSDFQHVDFDYKKPSTQLLSTASGSADGAFGQVYEFPGDFLVNDSGDALANIHLQEVEALRVTFSGKSTAPFFSAGYKFTMKKHPRDDLNATYILHSVTHTIIAEVSRNLAASSYINHFSSFPADITFRAPRMTPKPKIHGTQTAMVTGKNGEEIWTDQYGRIKVKFHWDQLGSDDEKSSCWIRVAQGWASSGWGMVFIPRIGMEVIVSFICGDPDRPLVTGTVYNADNTPPYLPNEPTKSTIYTNTTKGGSGYNEIRFEDKKGEEEIWVHAQKDVNIDIIHDRTVTIEKGDDTLDIQKGSRTTTIKKDYDRTLIDGDETILLKKGSRSVTLDKGDEEKTLKKGDRTITLKKGDETKLIKKGNYTRKVKGDYTLEVGG
ncbi:MAG: type VI secretion system tip protein VgrG, partial [Alphaproteobacteria bacterium]|nr:type VI secretion system tip protein VgrG [Alphaproteobacteria bacterium]